MTASMLIHLISRFITAAVVCACLAIPTCTTAIAQLPSPTVTFTPPAPTQSDIITVHVNTGLLCYPLAPTDGALTTIIGQQVQFLVSLSYCPSLTTPPAPYAFDTKIGPLASGAYEIQVSARFSADSGRAYSASELLGTTPLVVLAIPSSNPIPTIAQPAALALVLAIAVSGVAFLRCQRKHRARGVAVALIISVLLLPADSRAGTTFFERAADLASRQLIVLFDPGNPTSPTTSEVAASVTVPESNQPLYSALGQPRSAVRLFDGFSSPTLRAEHGFNASGGYCQISNIYSLNY